MKYFTQFSDKETLILIDEFGTGTEPQFGGAIAETILDRISGTGSFGVITTHYSNIKEFADRTPGMVNGAMRYDTDRLEPLFQLEIGKPGSSFAFEIAQKIGLSKEIINEAKKQIGTSHVNYDKLLAELESDKVKYEKLKNQMKQQSMESLEMRNDYEELKSMIEAERHKIINGAKEEGKKIIEQANRKVEKTIRDIKEIKADKEKTKIIREDLVNFGKRLIVSKPKKKPVKQLYKKNLEIGDMVRITGQEGIGEIVALKKKQVQVSFGELKSFVDLNRLEIISNKKAKEITKKSVGGLDLTSKMGSFSTKLDVRGKKAEEVISMVDQFIDDALLLGSNDLSILHGKGHGVLREIIRTHLHDDPHVLNVSDEHEDRGGSGITLISLK